MEGGPRASCIRSETEKGQSPGGKRAGVNSSNVFVRGVCKSALTLSEFVAFDEDGLEEDSDGRYSNPSTPPIKSSSPSSGLSPMESGRKGQIINSFSASVGGHPNRVLLTAKNPSTPAAPEVQYVTVQSC